MLPEPIMITGGAGFVGSVLTKALAARGQRTVVVDNLSFGKLALIEPLPKGCTFVRADLRDRAALAEVFRAHQPKTVIHLAALHFIPYCNEHPLEAMDVNVIGTRTVLELCRAAKPEQVFFASSAAVYPLETSPFREDDPMGPMEIYGSTKVMGEDLCRLFHYDSGIRTTIGRFFNVYGPNDTNPHLIPEIVSQLQHNGTSLRLGNLEPVRDFIHVEDVVSAVIALLEARRPGCSVFNIGSGQGYQVTDVVEAFAAGAGRPLPIVQDPQRIRKVERVRLVADIRRIREEIGWRPQITFAEGIRRLIHTQ